VNDGAVTSDDGAVTPTGGAPSGELIPESVSVAAASAQECARSEQARDSGRGAESRTGRAEPAAVFVCSGGVSGFVFGGGGGWPVRRLVDVDVHVRETDLFEGDAEKSLSQRLNRLTM